MMPFNCSSSTFFFYLVFPALMSLMSFLSCFWPVLLFVVLLYILSWLVLMSFFSSSWLVLIFVSILFDCSIINCNYGSLFGPASYASCNKNHQFTCGFINFVITANNYVFPSLQFFTVTNLDCSVFCLVPHSY
jgi:hypothetical protein